MNPTPTSRIYLSDSLTVSRLAMGHWRLNNWEMTTDELIKMSREVLELGVTTFDHADIYGDYSCEAIFGEALKKDTGLRKEIEIVTKCGIKLLSGKFPERKIKHYDYSYAHIVKSAEQSLRNFGTDYLDVLLLHRPSPFFDAGEVARAFSDLKQAGKVRFFGVSNFLPEQFRHLQSFCDMALVTNQIEISPIHLDAFEGGNLDFLQSQGVSPMAWSPLGGGKIFSPMDERGARVLDALKTVSARMGGLGIDQVVFSWLCSHPAGIVPVLGTGKLARVRDAMEASQIQMDLEDWFEIYTASLGHRVA